MFMLRAEHFVTESVPRCGEINRPFFEWLEFYEQFLGKPAIRRASEIVWEELGNQAGAILFDSTPEFNANFFNQVMEKLTNE
jgi:hypothetical protein